MKDVSVIIINHNTRALCSQAVTAVVSTTHKANLEIIIVDNSSNPDEQFTALDNAPVRLLLNAPNRGFGHACNIGAAEARGRYLLFLNSDTVLHDGALDRALDYIQCRPNTGALGIRTLLPDGSFDHGCKRGFPTPLASLSYFTGLDKRFPNNKRFGGYRLTYLSQNETNAVDAVSGAFLLIPRQLFQKLGGFDEAFFMYGEDLDLCYRVKATGAAVVYFADASMLHLKGQSGLNARDPQILNHFYEAMRLFYDKHYKKKYNLVTTWLVHLAIRCKQWLTMRQ